MRGTRGGSGVFCWAGGKAASAGKIAGRAWTSGATGCRPRWLETEPLTLLCALEPSCLLSKREHTSWKSTCVPSPHPGTRWDLTCPPAWPTVGLLAWGS